MDLFGCPAPRWINRYSLFNLKSLVFSFCLARLLTIGSCLVELGRLSSDVTCIKQDLEVLLVTELSSSPCHQSGLTRGPSNPPTGSHWLYLYTLNKRKTVWLSKRNRIIATSSCAELVGSTSLWFPAISNTTGSFCRWGCLSKASTILIKLIEN